MIVESIQGNIANLTPEEKQVHIEKVYLENSDLVKRIQRVKTDHGTEIGIRLNQPIDLQYGDILYRDDKNMIIIDVNSEDIIAIQPRTLKEMGDIAHQLGNRHLPAQFTDSEMLVQYDYLVEDLLKDLGIPYQREARKVNQAFKHIGHSHD
ncbi:urease accessory protein UreE [Staphylococcus chromogenes]|uniref:Urease accessory protein UreE n=1 Tax=Staphylococcus chromogenes TaxID=46126 RepID=A0AAJ2K8P4_STACR|nr:urease accessory protein UreE [Staphylococcus chromogenes]KDP12566.1 urease accessory protein UreE [Staphylococcus chromogenes MU 970]MBV5137796.1 urease accessory protein UreE [Staphylococcus chromogenes]MBV5191506.1 urease accessory protein UreE [Staphylococcus chromogenes]MBW3131854.1 urease accessory protein UreE [Staphylococcus chromogenes]MBW6089364.1 urease accessory protein UreE [Staphylococcus chromogenes]